MGRLLVYAFLSVPLIGAFTMFAMGIVVIYRASRVLNLAHGAMAMVPAYLVYSLSRAGLPVLLSVVLGVAAAALLGVLVEWVFVRRLRAQGPTAQTVGTVAVTGLLIALIGKLYGTAPIEATRVFPAGALRISGAAVRYGDIGLLGVALVVAAGMFAFFRFTEFGLAMRGAAQNRTAAVLMGVDPDRAASAAWALGGALAGLAGILLAAVTNLNPYALSLEVLPAFVAALIGGLESLPGALVGSLIAGLAFGLVPALASVPLIGRLMRLSGSPQLVLTVLAMVTMVLRGGRLTGVESASDGLAAPNSSGRPAVDRAPRPFLWVLPAVLLLAWPWLVPFSVLGSSLLAIEFAFVALSLVVLTGWVGQISLAQASFVGLGALVTASAARTWGLVFPANIVVGTLAAAACATALGAVALRVRGLYLAVATLIFAWMADAFLFRSPWLGAGSGSSTIPNQRIGREHSFPSFDFTSRRVLFFLLGALLIVSVSMLANVRRTRAGRAFAAVRGSEVAAASLGVDVVRYKLAAFALSGTLAGLGGSLLMLEQRTVVPDQFLFTASLQYLAIAVVGGLGSLPGAVGAGVLFAALNEVFFRVHALNGWLEVVSAGLLALVLLAYPEGLAGLGARLSHRLQVVMTRLDGPLEALSVRIERLADWIASRLERSEPTLDPSHWMAAPQVEEVVDEPVTRTVTSVVQRTQAPLPPLREDRPLRLAATDVTVRFGGLAAVTDASLEVREGEIVGLIGPNGAGKTTLFNAILGLNEPSTGRIEMYGQDVTNVPPHLRAGLGVSRTFQVLQLFPGLTVFENLLVATHNYNPSSLLGNMVASRATLDAETACRQRVREVLDLVRLSHLADEYAANLPFGMLRMVELGRALVTGARLMLLDEAASGLNDAETARMVDVIREVRDLGVAVLLIEHDVRMVTDVSDYIYVLDQGKLLAEGTPDVVRDDPGVIAAYLGRGAEASVELDAEPVGVG